MGENPTQEGRHDRSHAHAVDGRAERRLLARRADAGCAPTPPEDGYAPEHVNVEAQMHDPDSLLAFIRELRRAVSHLARDRLGRARVLPSGNDAVLAHRSRRTSAASWRCTTSRRRRRWSRSNSARSRPSRSCPTCSTSTARPRRARPHRRAARCLRVPLVPYRRARRPAAHLSDGLARMSRARIDPRRGIRSASRLSSPSPRAPRARAARRRPRRRPAASRRRRARRRSPSCASGA